MFDSNRSLSKIEKSVDLETTFYHSSIFSHFHYGLHWCIFVYDPVIVVSCARYSKVGYIRNEH